MTDVSPLEKSKTLLQLDIRTSSVSDVSPLAKLENLRIVGP